MQLKNIEIAERWELNLKARNQWIKVELLWSPQECSEDISVFKKLFDMIVMVTPWNILLAAEHGYNAVIKKGQYSGSL